MQFRLSPILKLYTTLAISLLLAMLAFWVAQDQRYIGLRLLATGPAQQAVQIIAVDPNGPAQALVEARSALVGITLADATGRHITIGPTDLLEEPDNLASYAEMWTFFERQGLITSLLRSGPITISLERQGQIQKHVVVPAQSRPTLTLPVTFWLQIAVGLGGVWIGAWIWALRQADWPARCLAVSGAGLLISAFAAAIYSTRELALAGDLFRVLSALNHFGAFLFGAGMIGLFMLYPRRLYPVRALCVPAIVLGFWYVLAQTGVLQTPAIGIHLGVVLALLAIAALVAQQFWATRGDPRDRAALSWLGLAVLVGSSAFVVTVIAPQLLGIEALISQGLAFVFFLLIYIGVALGVARFQLFELANWAYRILFYVAGVLFLLGIDALLIFTILDDRVPAFALSLLIVALIWLPLRDALGRWVLQRGEPARAERFRKIIDVALTPPGHDQQESWRALLAEMFNPLQIVSGTDSPCVALRDDGLTLALPRLGPLPALELRYADGGRRLYSLRDLELATDMAALLGQALESRLAYEKGVIEERARISRDIHDNIGVQLLAALHNPDAPRKDRMIRETLTDLRDIINNAANPAMSFDEVMAELRAQISDQLFIAGVQLTWDVDNPNGIALSGQTTNALRAIIRESVQNALKHANPTQLAISIHIGRGGVDVAIRDNGQGFQSKPAKFGNGLTNLSDRAAACGGWIKIDSTAKGTTVTASLPFDLQAGKQI
jgi:two-component system, NarL family, sensor histidine kinase DevS